MSNNQATSNKLVIIVMFILMVFGVFAVYTSSLAEATRLHRAPEFFMLSHLKKLLIALPAFLFCAKVDYGFWKVTGRYIFYIGLFLCILALFMGGETKGASRWIGGIQPSEILKFGLFTVVCARLSDAGDAIKSLKCSLIQPGIPFVLSAIVLFLQPNMSMLMLFTGVVFLVLILSGARLKYLLSTVAAALPVVAIMFLVKGHAMKRITAFFDPNAHHGASYQSAHSLAALGNGGLFGTGVGMGVEKLGYLPESHKDVVYAVIGEELGFAGTFCVLLAFGILFWQCFNVARSSQTRFGKYLCVAFTLSMFFNFLIHVCVCTNLIPTTGQPLPFLSFGGTNLIFSAMFIGIIYNISCSNTGRSIKEPYVNGSISPSTGMYANYDFRGVR